MAGTLGSSPEGRLVEDKRAGTLARATGFAHYWLVPRSPQPDLFEDDLQNDLFGEDTPTPEYRPDLDDARARLHKILAEARAADKLPWDRANS